MDNANFIDFELIPAEGNLELSVNQDGKIEVQFIPAETSENLIMRLIDERNQAREEVNALKEENDNLRKDLENAKKAFDSVTEMNLSMHRKMNRIQNIIEGGDC
jgi:hypothetical protein